MKEKKDQGLFKLIVNRPDGAPVNEYFNSRKERDEKASFYEKQKIKTEKS